MFNILQVKLLAHNLENIRWDHSLIFAEANPYKFYDLKSDDPLVGRICRFAVVACGNDFFFSLIVFRSSLCMPA